MFVDDDARGDSQKKRDGGCSRLKEGMLSTWALGDNLAAMGVVPTRRVESLLLLYHSTRLQSMNRLP